jgi:hypothetical protein
MLSAGRELTARLVLEPSLSVATTFDKLLDCLLGEHAGLFELKQSA